jgi:membrane protease YdiL (CAAX protease family)
VGFALAVDALPGFTKILLLDSVQVSAAAVPFTLDINLAKLGAGLIILVTVFSAEERRLPSLGQIKQSLLPIFITICITLAMSSVFLIDFDPKLSPYLLLFILSNIFIAVITEEAFFRGLIYKPLANVVSPLIAVIITGILFGLAHFGMGRWDYILVASVAGCGYGYLFMKTGRLAMPVITHFSLNLTHFVMFTYPFLPFVGT